MISTCFRRRLSVTLATATTTAAAAVVVIVAAATVVGIIRTNLRGFDEFHTHVAKIFVTCSGTRA